MDTSKHTFVITHIYFKAIHVANFVISQEKTYKLKEL